MLYVIQISKEHSMYNGDSYDGNMPSIPTTLFVDIPTDRDYAPVLVQTEVVYDQLLAERYQKFKISIDDKIRQFNCKYLELVNAGDLVKVSESSLIVQHVVIDFRRGKTCYELAGCCG